MEKHTNIQEKTAILFVLGNKQMVFKDALIKWRKARGLTQEELAEATNYSIPYISNLETGKQKRPSEKVCKVFARVLNVPLSDMLEAAGYSAQTTGETRDFGGVKVQLYHAHDMTKKEQEEFFSDLEISIQIAKRRLEEKRKNESLTKKTD